MVVVLLLSTCRQHLLATPLDLKDYTTPNIAEMARFELDDVDYIVCYTPDSHRACELIRRCEKYMLDHPDRKVVFTGDFNAHNTEVWCSATATDAARLAAQEMCESFGLHQFVDFPTRGKNTLDLIMSPFPGSAIAMANPGTSDHIAIAFEMQVISHIQDAPPVKQAYNWDHAPWNHINGAIRRFMHDWDPACFDSVQVAQINFNEWMESIVERYVPLRDLNLKGCAPWWNYHCEKAYKLKVKAFACADESPDRYLRAVQWNKSVQRKAFHKYNLRLKSKLDKMSNSDRNFWSLVKDIGGLDSSRSNAAPDKYDLACHFADKMTSGKDEADLSLAPNSPSLIPLSSFKIRFKSVSRTLRKLDPSKSANGVGPRFLKECADALAPLVCKLFKFIVRKCTVPPGWKLGRVTPVHKRGSVALCQNYRPA